MSHLPLHRHPSTPCACASALSVRAEWTSDDLLSLTYCIEGDIDELRLPAPRPSQHGDGLWRSTCFEAFVRAPGEPGYVELNVSPSNEWAIYRFVDYRRGMQALVPNQPPKIVCHRRQDELEADIGIDLASLGLPLDSDLKLGLAAVLEDCAGALSYWALAHPDEEPDFHHQECFVLTLPRA